MSNNLFDSIILSFKNMPRDVVTVPTTKREGKWFYVSSDGTKVYVQSGKHHKNASVIKGVRMLNPSKTEQMLSFYHRRKNGESVSAEAQAYTVNQAYWYGIFAELGL